MKKLLAIVCCVLIIGAAMLLSAQRYQTSTRGPVDGSGAQLITRVQGVTLKNSENTSAAATAQTVSITALAGQSVYLYGIAVRASAAPVTPCGVTVKDGVAGTIIWSTDTAYVKATETTQTFPTPLASTLGNGMDIVVSTCGTAITSTIDVQASQF